MDYKYIEQVSTLYTRYYASLKNIFDNQMKLEHSLDLYHLDINIFRNLFEQFTNTTDYTKFIEKNIEYEQL